MVELEIVVMGVGDRVRCVCDCPGCRLNRTRLHGACGVITSIVPVEGGNDKVRVLFDGVEGGPILMRPTLLEPEEWNNDDS